MTIKRKKKALKSTNSKIVGRNSLDILQNKSLINEISNERNEAGKSNTNRSSRVSILSLNEIFSSTLEQIDEFSKPKIGQGTRIFFFNRKIGQGTLIVLSNERQARGRVSFFQTKDGTGTRIFFFKRKMSQRRASLFQMKNRSGTRILFFSNER